MLDAQGKVLDTDVRNIDVPDLQASATAAPMLLPTWIVGALTSRALQLAAADLQIAPAASKTFRRIHHLLIRVPVFDPSGAGVRVTATLLNQRGVAMRSLDLLGRPREDVSDFALPLATLALGEYQLELRAGNQYGSATERLTFRVIG